MRASASKHSRLRFLEASKSGEAYCPRQAALQTPPSPSLSIPAMEEMLGNWTSELEWATTASLNGMETGLTPDHTITPTSQHGPSAAHLQPSLFRSLRPHATRWL